jgi:Na+/proline symporter/signal transduction histidine kinase
MVHPWITLFVAIVYVLLLFAVASYGDRKILGDQQTRSRPNIYAFSLAIYCTTWTFFGSVGLSSTNGVNFIAIYLGPILIVTLGFPLVRRVIKLSKEERITSVADFIGSRFGKNNKVAAVAAIIAVVGTIPYIALQLKAISRSVDTLLVSFDNGFPSGAPPFGDISLLVAIALVIFAILFGTRHADATEHQHGLMLAIAMESVIKLIAFLFVGIFVTWFMFDGIADLLTKAAVNPNIQQIIDNGFDAGNFLILTFLSCSVFLLLPRQFHVAVVENNSMKELERARWLFPAYLVAINLFVIPIALAGTLKFGVAANADDYVLLLPLLEDQRVLGLLVFIGGLSAGTAMVIVASVALAIMISNDLVLPVILRMRSRRGLAEPKNMETTILNIRRTSIFAVLFLAYLYYEAADNSAALASIGLVSFAAIAQLAPAFFGGLFWKKANARGAMLGMAAGFFVWAYCLLLPTLLSENNSFVVYGLFDFAWLKPESLFGTSFSPIANGVIWSLFFNTTAFVAGSLSRDSDPLERMQASLFVAYQAPAVRYSNADRSNVQVGQLKQMLMRYIGEKRTERSFASYWSDQNLNASDHDYVDNNILRFSEQLLASAIGASSSRLVHTLLLKRYDNRGTNNLELLDEASRALQFNRDVLQTALDQIEQGITVFDGDFRLASWNTQFRKILNLPTRIGQVGLPLSEVAREIALQNNLGEMDENGEAIMEKLINQAKAWQLKLPMTDQILEISTSPMPEGGIVVTWHNITQRVKSDEAIKEAYETLEGRVEERTRELEQAKQFADQANASKTRFLAAAGHDVLQPLNAARLYSATLIERANGKNDAILADNINKSLGSVEEILASILAISRLDTANPEINITSFPLSDITKQLQIEFEPIAQSHGLELGFVHCTKWVKTDRAQLRRLLQNLISNAIKFTQEGRVLVGCRNLGNRVSLEVHDTGIGIPEEHREHIFGEFHRLNNMSNKVPGLGLGLSIVDRIAQLLGLRVELENKRKNGTTFKLELETTDIGADSRQVRKITRKRKLGQLTDTSILCIDNEEAILQGMHALLSEWGCVVATATDYEEAIDLLKGDFGYPDLILADYHLEETTGISVYEKLLGEINKSIPGVLITADRSEEVKKLAEKSGLSLLNKPVRPAALRALVTENKRRAIAAE